MNLDEIVDNIILKTGDDYEKCVLFMVGCLALIPKPIPPVGIKSIDIATKFWLKNQVDDAQLEKARIACWHYLDSHCASTNIEESKFCAIRAIICVLYSNNPSSYSDNDELLDCFFDMLISTNKNTEQLITELTILAKTF